MLAMSFNDATARLWELRSEIWQATIDTFVMLGISTTAAIIIGGFFGVFLFLTSDKQLLQNKTFMRYWAVLPTLCALSPSLS